MTLPDVGSTWRLKSDELTTQWLIENNYVNEFAPFDKVVIVKSNDVSITFRPLDRPLPEWAEGDEEIEDFLFTGNFERIYEAVEK